MEQRWSIKYTVLPRPDALIGDARIEFLDYFATEVIKHGLHSRKKKTEIAMWVHANFPPRDAMTSFVQNMPLSVVVLVTRGVVHFAPPAKRIVRPG
jgi:hypothetical protein